VTGQCTKSLRDSSLRGAAGLRVRVTRLEIIDSVLGVLS